MAWRQNAALLIDNGQLNPLTNDGAAWGGVWLNKAATWRSGWALPARDSPLRRGRVADGGDAGHGAAGGRRSNGDADGHQSPVGARLSLRPRKRRRLQITKLNPGMQGTGQVSAAHTRDFFYITRALPSSSHGGQ